MNLTQALSLCDDHCTVSPNICDHCQQPVAFLFNWDMAESLCMACFIRALYTHDDAFRPHLALASNHEQLLKLCQAYQLDGLYFPPGPDEDPAAFFEIEALARPTYQPQGGIAMDPAQKGLTVIREQSRGREFTSLTPRPVAVRELPASERPVNRLHKYGAGSLSNAEIIAAVIQTPNALHEASSLLARYHGLLGLTRASIHELQDVPGLGPAKTAQLKAAMELGRRVLIASPGDRIQVKSPSAVANLLMAEMSILEQEHMRLVLLNSKNYVIDTPTMYIGGLNCTTFRVGELFREAVRQNCAAVIVVHNHPSGDPTPSPEDVAVTELITQAGKVLDIDVLDHLIIGRQRYISLKERGLGFN